MAGGWYSGRVRVCVRGGGGVNCPVEYCYLELVFSSLVVLVTRPTPIEGLPYSTEPHSLGLSIWFTYFTILFRVPIEMVMEK